MTASIDYLPIWKKGAPIHERLMEIAEIARKHPDYFDKWCLVYCEDNDEQFKVRTVSGDATRTSDTLAVLTAGIQHVWQESQR